MVLEFKCRSLDGTKQNDRALIEAFEKMQWLKTEQCEEILRIVNDMFKTNSKQRAERYSDNRFTDVSQIH